MNIDKYSTSDAEMDAYEGAKALGMEIARLRKAKDLALTQEKFARWLDVTTNYYNRIENGVVVPSPALMSRIMGELGGWTSYALVMFGRLTGVVCVRRPITMEEAHEIMEVIGS